jgi:hypothetical protein
MRLPFLHFVAIAIQTFATEPRNSISFKFSVFSDVTLMKEKKRVCFLFLFRGSVFVSLGTRPTRHEVQGKSTKKLVSS